MRDVIWRCDLVPQYLKYKDEIDSAIERVLVSGRHILGEECAAFEREFAAYLGVRHVVGVADGTRALTLALRAVGVGAGDEVITTPFTAFPTIGAIVEANAVPVFADVDAATYLMDIEQVPSLLSARTRAVMPVHLFGNVVDVEALRALIPQDVAIVEDAAQAHGSSIRGRRAGSLGDIAGFSFYPTKNLGGYGDGGAIATNDDAIASRIRLLRAHGMPDKDHVVEVGVNSRLDELQAAVLRVKLPHLDQMNERRRAIGSRYRSELPADRFEHQRIGAGVITNEHVFEPRFSGDRDGLGAFLAERRIQTNVYYPTPQHRQPAMANVAHRVGAVPNAERLAREVIALPMYAELGDGDVANIIAAIREFEALVATRPSSR